jgi:hypothetical protein
MGYESKLYVGRKVEITNNEDKPVRTFFIEEATFRLGKVNSDKFRQNSSLFTTPIDFKINEYEMLKEISYDKDREVTTAEIVEEIDEDMYGTHLCCASVERVIEELQKIYDESIYSPYLRVLAYLKSLKECPHEDYVVVHYGY